MQFTFLINWGMYACCFNIKTLACNIACRLRHLWLLCMLEGWGVAQHLHSNSRSAVSEIVAHTLVARSLSLVEGAAHVAHSLV